MRDANGKFSMAKPPNQGKPGGGGGGGTNVLGASWTGGGAVLKQTGKVLFTMNSGDYICTGTVIADTTNDRSRSSSRPAIAPTTPPTAASPGTGRSIPDFDTNGDLHLRPEQVRLLGHERR